MLKTRTTRTMPKDYSLEKWYRKTLLVYVDKMAKETNKKILAGWKKNPPRTLALRVAADVSSPREMDDIIKSLQRNWDRYFKNMSEQVADEFVRRAERGTTGHLTQLLKEAGFGVKWGNTRELNEMLQAATISNVNLITSISSEYFTQIESIVMEGIKNGRDLAFMTDELQKRLNISENRARFIAHDQTNKTTGAISRARNEAAGIKEAIWQHFGGKKSFREAHKAMDGEKFDLAIGLQEPGSGEFIFPGEKYNCNCKYKIVVPAVRV